MVITSNESIINSRTSLLSMEADFLRREKTDFKKYELNETVYSLVTVRYHNILYLYKILLIQIIQTGF